METTLNNGTQYRFEEIFKGFIKTYCFYDGKWNHISRNFHSWNEVNEWVEKMNAPVENNPINTMRVEDYYTISGYYGD